MAETRGPNHMRPTNLTRFLFGAPYYPEHWTEEDMAHDPDLMAAAGFGAVRMAEFAWDRMEPREGCYDFRFFDEHVARLWARGIGTILCTPTAAPPRWLTRTHADVLRADSDGRRMQHGSRQHACHSSRTFRSYSRGITRAMAEHYRDNPAVLGWQTDNEFFCHFAECFCGNCTTAFRAWLEARYGDVAALNAAWGTSFWALTYDSFEDVDLPRPGRPTHVNPTHSLDYKLFLSDEVVSFQREQVALLRAAQPKWFVTHNGQFAGIDYRRFCLDLDFFGVDIYPGFVPVADRAATVALTLDTARSFAGNFVVPEQQSGPGGQGDFFHDAPRPGQMRLWSYQSIARGADSILHFRWRTCRFGSEQYWEGILDHDNVPRRRYREAAEEGREFAELSEHLMGTWVSPAVGVLYDSGLPQMGHSPITLGLPSPSQAAAEVHGALYSAGFSVGIVHPDDDLASFKVVILPSWGIVTEDLAQALTAYVEGGGFLIVGGRSAHKNALSHVTSCTLPGVLSAVTGIEVTEYSRVNEPKISRNAITWEGGRFEHSRWMEQLQPHSADVIGRWSHGTEAGTPAMTLNRYGQGLCLYVGTILSSDAMAALIPLLSARAGLSPLLAGCPAGVEVSVREGAGHRLWFLLNHTSHAVEIPDAPIGRDLVRCSRAPAGAITLQPYGVAVVRQDDSEQV